MRILDEESQICLHPFWHKVWIWSTVCKVAAVVLDTLEVMTFLFSLSCRWDKQVISVREARAFPKNNSLEWNNKFICVEGMQFLWTNRPSLWEMSTIIQEWFLLFQSLLKEITWPGPSTRSSSLMPLKLNLLRYVGVLIAVLIPSSPSRCGPNMSYS